MHLQQSHFPPERSEPVAEITLGELLANSARAAPQRLCLVETDPGRGVERQWTYMEVFALAEATALRLAHTYKPGERLAIWAPNRAEWLFLYLGAALAGLVVVPINPAYLTGEAEYVLRQSRAVGLFYAREFRGVSKEAMWLDMHERLPLIREARAFEGWEQFMAAPAAHELPVVTASDPVLILYTSGTTGAPKGAVLTHRGVVNLRLATSRLELAEGSVWLNFMPMFHIGGAIYMTVGALWNCGTQVMTPGFDAALVLQLIETRGIAFFIAVPTMLLAMLDHPDFKRRRLESLQVIGSGGATVPAELVHRVQSEFGVDFAMMFGQTETALPVTHSLRSDSVRDKAETVGPAIGHTEIKIVDPATGCIVPTGAVGEICVRAVGVMQGYFDQPEANATVFDADGWLHTGDLGTLDAAGYCRVTGRLKDMIIRGGENISPREVEDNLLLHAAIADAAVFGIPDSQWGEQVVAAVRLRPGSERNPAELEQFLRGRLARHKVPRFWQFVDEFPVTPSGKIQKFILRERYIGASTPLPDG